MLQYTCDIYVQEDDEQVKKVFSFFSNTVEEFEPRSIAKKTKYQRDNNIDSVQENVGDTVYIVVGANVKIKLKTQSKNIKLKGLQ